MKISYENVVRSKRRGENFVVFDKLSRLTLAFLPFLFSLLFAIFICFSRYLPDEICYSLVEEKEEYVQRKCF